MIASKTVFTARKLRLTQRLYLLRLTHVVELLQVLKLFVGTVFDNLKLKESGQVRYQIPLLLLVEIVYLVWLPSLDYEDMRTGLKSILTYEIYDVHLQFWMSVLQRC